MNDPNETKYQQLIEIYKKKYLSQYNAGKKKADDKNYFRTKFQNDVLTKNESKIYPSISNAVHFRNEKKWLENIDSFAAIKEYCKSYKQTLSTVQKKMAEYDAITLVWQEIRRIEYDLVKKESVNDPATIQSFTLKDKVISKIDFIRIINSLSELRGFIYQDGTIPAKQEIMRAFGKIVGIDLSNYDKDLSKAFKNSSVEANIEIFKRMEAMTTSICTDKTLPSKD